MKAIVHCWVRRLMHPSWWFQRTDAIAVFDSYFDGKVHVNDLAGEGYTYHIKRAHAAGDAHAAIAASGVLPVNLSVKPITEAQIREAVETLRTG